MAVRRRAHDELDRDHPAAAAAIVHDDLLA